jgi:hypothetical protein
VAKIDIFLETNKFFRENICGVCHRDSLNEAFR